MFGFVDTAALFTKDIPCGTGGPFVGVVSRFRGSLSEWSGVSNPDDCGTRVKVQSLSMTMG